MDWHPRAARFRALPLLHCILLIFAMTLVTVAAATSAAAQGAYGVGGYLVRPEQDIENDPSSIDPNATDSSRELLKRKQQLMRQGVQAQPQVPQQQQPQQQSQPQSQQHRNRPVQEERAGRHPRRQDRVEETARNKTTRKNRGRDAQPQAPGQNAAGTNTGGTGQSSVRGPRETAQPGPSEGREPTHGVGESAASGVAVAPASEAAGEAGTPAVAPVTAGTPTEMPPVAQDDSKAKVERAAAQAALVQDRGRFMAEAAIVAQKGAQGAGDTTAAVRNVREALVETAVRVERGEGAAKRAAILVGAAHAAGRNTAALHTATKAGADFAAQPPSPAAAQGEGDAAKVSVSAETATVADAQQAPAKSEVAAPAPQPGTVKVASVEADPQSSATATTPAVAPAGAQGQSATAADPLDKMIGQMLMVGFEGTSPEDPSVRKLAAQIASGQVGGVLYLERNIVSPQQVKKLNAYLHGANPGLPALLAIDQEGGAVQRLSHDKGFPEFPSAGQIGQSNDPLNAHAVYERMAAELAEYGFNVNLGPVVDLWRADNAVIAGEERSFGDRPRHVAAFAKAFCIAHRSAGLLTVLKHFPGDGSSRGDTHTDTVDVSETWKPDELEPYRELISSGDADMVMTGHIAHRDWSGDARGAASLSEHAVMKMLRGDLGFTGVVIADDLEMGAISKLYSPEQSAIRAIKAGNNIVMFSNKAQPSSDLPERIALAIRKAVQDGGLTREQIEQSYERVSALKQKLRAQNARLTAKHDDGVATSAPAQ